MTASKPLWDRGCVQVYTGNGKGKTTAALGLALRAAGAGLKVLLAQFCKGRPTGEHKALQRFDDLITVRQYGRDQFIDDPPTEEDIRAAQGGLREVERLLASGEYQVVILDEVNFATCKKLISVEDILRLIETRPRQVELVLTGRHADPRVIERADLVTEMREVKHPYERGLGAREGIEE